MRVSRSEEPAARISQEKARTIAWRRLINERLEQGAALSALANHGGLVRSWKNIQSSPRANITLANIVDRDQISFRTWERGVGVTKACGSGACATAVAAARLKRTSRTVEITLPGGELDIEWRERDDRILMTGTATFEYEGTFDRLCSLPSCELEVPLSIEPSASARHREGFGAGDQLTLGCGAKRAYESPAT